MAIGAWFALGLIARGLEFRRAELDAELESRRSDEVPAELRAINARLASLERSASPERGQPRAV